MAKMKKKIWIIDTNILCVYLQVPNKDTCENADATHIIQQINTAAKEGVELVLPIAVIIETGNHIGNIADGNGNARRTIKQKFTDLVTNCINGVSPWKPFNNQKMLFDDENLMQLMQDWNARQDTRSTIGDISILQVKEFYTKKGIYEVSIYTCDEGLRAYNDPIHTPTLQAPRRRK